MPARRPVRLLAALLVGVLLIGACTDGADRAEATSSTVGSATFPTIVTAENGEVELPVQPKRIVSLSASLTEMLYAVGAGPQVVAVDRSSDHPEGAPVGALDGAAPDLTAIAAHDPDLVVVAADVGGIVAALDGVDVPALVLSSAVNLEHLYEQLAVLGDATGHSDRADEVAADIGRRIDAIVEEVGDVEGQTYFYELGDDLSTVTSDTFIGRLLSLLGLRNIADGAPAAAQGSVTLTAEQVVAADPTFIFFAHPDAPADPATVVQRPGWVGLSAFERGNAVVLPSGLSTRWGPRVVELLEIVAGAVADGTDDAD